VTFKGAPLASAAVAVEVREAGTQNWKSATIARTDSSGNFTATIAAQPSSYSWRATAIGDGWARSDTTVSGSTDVPSPLVLAPTVPRATLPGAAVPTSAVVQFHHAPVPNVLVTASIQRAGTTTWVPVGQARSGVDGKVTLTIPAQTTDFSWKFTVPGNGNLQLTASTQGSTGIASRPLVTASATPIVTQSHANPVTGTITFRALPVAAPITVQIKKAGAATWLTVASTTANAHGTFTTAVPAQTSNYDWRVIAPADGFTRLAASVTGSTKVKLGVAAHVVSKTSVSGIPTIAAGSKPTFVGVTSPHLAGIQVVLRHWDGGAWKVVASTKTNAQGAFTLSGIALVGGPTRYQVLAYPGANVPNVFGYTGALQVTHS
jgi:hypothetical protein